MVKNPEIKIQQDRIYKTHIAPTNSRETKIFKISDRVWVFMQPFLQLPDNENAMVGDTFGVKMIIYKFKNGDVFVHNPIGPTEECIRLIKENVEGNLGKIKYVVVGGETSEHSDFPPDFCEKVCPNASVWILPSLYEKIKSGKQQFYDQLLKNEKLFVLSNGQKFGEDKNEVEVETKLLSGMHSLNEAQFLLKDEKVLAATDVVFGFYNKNKQTIISKYFMGIQPGKLSPIFAQGAWILTAIFKQTLQGRQNLIDFYVDVCKWDFDHVIQAHGDMFLDVGKQEQVRMVRDNYGKNLV